MNNETTTALLAALVALRDEASNRASNARNQYDAANALPKGTKGKRDAVTTADATLKASTDVLESLRLKIRDAMKVKARAIVAAAMATLDHPNADPIARQVLAARHDPRHQSAVTLGRHHGVHARVTVDGVGLPSYIELSLLATPAEHREQVERWLSRATTDEGKAAAQVYLDKPDAYPLSHFGSSVTVSRGYGGHSDTYGVNGSTFTVGHDNDLAARLQILHEVAWHLRSALNGADLPKVNDLEDLMEGNG